MDMKKPSWIKVKIDINDNYKDLNRLVINNKLHTVCQEARCPNIYECWSRKTATIMILGGICTRSCGFCSVSTGKPKPVDMEEPKRAANAVKQMGLKHVVITSVDRDDLRNDYGAYIWSKTILEINNVVPSCKVEVLTPDFQGNKNSLDMVFKAQPDIFSHNIECVERISRSVRPQSRWNRSKKVLSYSVETGMLTKTGMMVGLGEQKIEVLDTMKEIADLGVSIFNIGQYLQPTKRHLTVQRYVHPDEFLFYKEKGVEFGFDVVESGPLVRSSYMAEKQAENILVGES